MDSGAYATGKVFDDWLQQKRPRFEPGPEFLWEGIQSDALGNVLRFLPCKADRARVRSVCRSWRDAALGHAVPPPLPLLVLPRFSFSSLTLRGTLTTPRRAWMPPELAGADISCVGSYGNWLVGAKEDMGECFLVNPFSHELINLPCLRDSGPSCPMYSLHKVVLSASPDSGSECIVAAFGYRGSTAELSLWTPGMKSWHICRDPLIGGFIDATFCEGTLYIVWRFAPCLIAVDFTMDEHGVSATYVEDCLIESLLPTPLSLNDIVSCNVVDWNGNLLLIIRYYGGYQARNNVIKVEILGFDWGTTPYGVVEMPSIGLNCVFVGSGGCKLFRAGPHDGFEDSNVYFVPDQFNPHDSFVYSMREAAVRPFGFEPQPASFKALEDILRFPVWLFPSE